MSLNIKELLPHIFTKVLYVLDRHTDSDWYIVNSNCTVSNIIYVYDGKGTFVQNGETKEISAGDLVFFNEGCSRDMRTDPDNPLKFYTVNFIYTFPHRTGTEWKCINYPLPFDFVKKVTDKKLEERIISLFKRLINIQYAGERTKIYNESEIMQKLLDACFFLYDGQTDNYSDKLRVDKVIKYIEENYDKKITLSQLASVANLSASYFNTIFRNVVGMSPVNYLIYFRIVKAKELLLSDLSIEEVAFASGFSDVFYFSRTFKRLEKITPSQYAKQNKKKLNETELV